MITSAILVGANANAATNIRARRHSHFVVPQVTIMGRRVIVDVAFVVATSSNQLTAETNDGTATTTWLISPNAVTLARHPGQLESFDKITVGNLINFSGTMSSPTSHSVSAVTIGHSRKP